MTFEEFSQSKFPPKDVGPALLALWHDAQGDWDRAHTLAQEENGRAGSWVHAYLHRKEGDAMNARYWYTRAGQPEATGSLENEWAAIARALLSP